MEKKVEPAASEPEKPFPPINYAWYVVGVLMLIYVFSFVDRQILALLIEPIKKDFGISDFGMSLLMGPAFVVIFVFFGLFFGRLTDTKNRVLLIAIGLVLWSLATSAGSLTTGFMSLLIVRFFVGIGEAALAPAGYSIISDYFPPNRRATAISIFSMGIYLGSGLAFTLGGVVYAYFAQFGNYNIPLIGEIRPWQMVFLVVGLPGILFALILLTIREPARRDSKLGADGKIKALPIKEVIGYLTKNRRALLLHNFGFGCIALVTYGTGSWIASFFIRLHGWSPVQTGLVLGIITLVAGPLGIVAGGRLADYLASRGVKDANLRVPFYAILIASPIGLLYPILNQATLGETFSKETLGILAVIAFIPTSFLTSMPFGCAAAAIQQMMPNEMRGQASSLYLFINNLVGYGLGPTLVGLFTDKVFGSPNSVNFSLLTVGTIFFGVALLLLYLARKPYLDAQKMAEDWRSAHAA